ncbi:MAG: SDR family oxidoreductase [Acidobacteria bacterium]|nr:SDR family oxidoreductase [Acidobacteriota bacterium]
MRNGKNGLFFQDRNVLITGAGRGIGKRLALGFAAAGARVGLLARSKAELDLANLEISHAGGQALRLRADVRDFEQVAAAVELCTVQFGPLDVAVCAAAVQGPIGPLVEAPLREWIETLETNLLGFVHVCRAALPPMIARRNGKILALVGGGAADARPNFSAYSASKTAVVRLVETLAEEVRDHNVQVNCMSPGGSYTHMTDQILSAGERAGWAELERAEQVRLTGGVAAEKQIELALFLASERSNHISGRFLHVGDDWRRLEHANIQPDIYTLRRIQRT